MKKACIRGEDIAQTIQCKQFLVVKYSTMNSLFIGSDKIMLQLRKQVFWIHNLRDLHPRELFNKKKPCQRTLSAISERANLFCLYQAHTNSNANSCCGYKTISLTKNWKWYLKVAMQQLQTLLYLIFPAHLFIQFP